MRHPVHALFRVTALAALLAFPARALRRRRPRPGRSGRPDHADEPRRGHRVPGEEVRGRAQDPEAGAGSRVVGRAGQTPDQGAHAHPPRHRHHRRLQAARSRHQAVQEGDRDPGRHRADEVAGDARVDGRFQRGEEGCAAPRRRRRRRRRPPPTPPATPPPRRARRSRAAGWSTSRWRKASRGAPSRSPSASRTTWSSRR